MNDYYGTEMVTRLGVDPSTLALALTSRERITYSCHLPLEFWLLLGAGEAKLHKMQVPRRFAVECPPEHLAMALNMLKELDFERDFAEDGDAEDSDCFSSEQVVKIFEQMAKNTKLNKVSVEISEENILNHYELPSGLFALALANVEEVRIQVKDERHFHPEISELLTLLGNTTNTSTRRVWLSVDSSGKKFPLDSALIARLRERSIEVVYWGDISLV